MTLPEKLTPAMQQYYEFKKEYADSIIFFRMGDFYEMFGEDAHIAHKVLGINITSRNKNAKNPEALAWFPHHVKDKYLPLLVHAWYKVAIVEQVSDPKLKGIVKREVVRVVTPATLSLEWENYEDMADTIMIAISHKEDVYGLSVLNVADGSWKAWEFSSFESLQKELFKLSPKEVILEKTLFSDTSIKETLSKKYALNIYYFEFTWEAKKVLLEHFHTQNLKWFGIDHLPWAIGASALLLSYLSLNQKTSLSHLQTISKYDTTDFLELDAQTMKNLDLVLNLSTNSNTLGTLFWVLHQTKTSMGKRLLRENILFPPKNKKEIQTRLDIVEILKNDTILLKKLREKLGYISDLDAILSRLALGRVGPRDLLNLKQSLQSVVEIGEILHASEHQKLKDIFEK